MSRRLEVLLSRVEGPVVADIGCDHAWLSAQAVRTGRACRVYACDVAQGPLNRARATIEKEGVAESVIPLLSDGLQALPEACSQIVIAGMGAETIVSILESGADRLDPDTRLLLSPHTKASVLRDWLDHNGWRICREQFVQDRGRFYPVMDVCHADRQSGLRPEERLFGVHTVQDETWQLYLAQEKEKLCRLLLAVPPARRADVLMRLQLLESLQEV